MAIGQDIRITDVPFSSVPDTSATVFINDKGKLRQTDLTTIAKYSELYTLILGAHEDAMSEIQTQFDQNTETFQTQFEQSTASLQTQFNESMQTLQTTEDQLVANLNALHDELKSDLNTSHTNQMNEMQQLIDDGHEKLLKDINTVDDLRDRVDAIELSLVDVTIAILKDDWAPSSEEGMYYQSISVPGLTEQSSPMLNLVSSDDITTDEEWEAYACVIDSKITKDTITFFANTIPSISFTVIAKGVVSSEYNQTADITNLVTKINKLENEVDELNSKLPKVLWTASSLPTTFAPQTVTLRSTDYDELYVVYRIVSTSKQVYTSSFGNKGEEITCALPTGGSNQSGGRRLRNANISASGDSVTFQDGVVQNDGSGIVVDNTGLIPIRIIGFKYQ